MRNFEDCVQLYKHRLALKEVIKSNKHLDEKSKYVMLERAKFHDIDKMIMYLFWDKDKASEWHRKTAPHHRIDMGVSLSCCASAHRYSDVYWYGLESIFNWECVGITNPDKSLNAYDTVCKLYPDYKGVLLQVLEDLHMNSSYKVRDTFGITDLVVTKDDIIREVIPWLLRIPSKYESTEISAFRRSYMCTLIELFRQRNDLPAIRGLDEAYNEMAYRVRDFYSKESSLERAKEKLLTGRYQRYDEGVQSIRTQRDLHLCCMCDADTGKSLWYIAAPEIYRPNAITPHKTIVTYLFPTYTCLRGICSALAQLCKDSKVLIKVGDLSVYIFNDYIFGIVAEEIVFCFAYFKDEAQIVSCRLKGNYLIFDYVDISTYNNARQSFRVSVIDYGRVFS